mgnify:CR=1 FL=1
MRKRLISECAIIVILASAAGFGANLFHPDGFVFVKKKSSSSAVVRIDTREALIKHSSGKALFLDARERTAFERGHIAGALSLPAFPDAVRQEMTRRHFLRINSPVELVVYCEASSCGAAELLAESITGKGYTRHIYLLKDGFEAWQSKGNPTGEGQ